MRYVQTQETKECSKANDFKLAAQIVVDQHYAAGPDRMKVLAQALAEAVAPAKAPGSPREQLR